MDLHYQIQFHTDWHCGSGLAAGADLDALVVKDKEDLPFIPGKTIKGLVREAVEDMKRGSMFFTNTELPENERKAIVDNDAARFLYRSISNTAIDEEGIAKEHSLRRMQVVVPCILEGKILNISDEMKSEIEQALKYIKRLGQNRNRGLGRCSFTIIKKEEK